jgi:hypothetical protein
LSINASARTITDDIQTKYEMQLLANVKEERDPKVIRSHHQEAGKQWARQTKEERRQKLQQVSPNFEDNEEVRN